VSKKTNVKPSYDDARRPVRRPPAVVHDFESAARALAVTRSIRALEKENDVLARLVREARGDVERLRQRLAAE
jgi:hypothetical protein